MPNRIDTLLAELGAALETTFPEGSTHVANLDLPSGRALTVMTSEAYEALLADSLAWKAITRGQPDTMSAEDTIALLQGPDAR